MGSTHPSPVVGIIASFGTDIHVLLPMWITSFRFGGRIFRILVNARTGEVQGERPYSWVKITLFVLAIAAVIIGFLYYANL